MARVPLPAIATAFQAIDRAIASQAEAFRAQEAALDQLALPPDHEYHYEIAATDQICIVGYTGLRPLPKAAYGKIAVATRVLPLEMHTTPRSSDYNRWAIDPKRIIGKSRIANQFDHPPILIALGLSAFTDERFTIVPHEATSHLGQRVLNPRILRTAFE